MTPEGRSNSASPETSASQDAADTQAEDSAAVEEPPIVRFSVNVARDSADILRSTAVKKGLTVTDVFRRAISMMEAIDEELESGRDIQSVGRDGSRTRIVFR